MNIEGTLGQPSFPIFTYCDHRFLLWNLQLVVVFIFTCKHDLVFTLELLLIEFIEVFGFFTQFDLSDVEHIESSCTATKYETEGTQDSELVDRIIEEDENNQSTGQHDDIGRICETISVIYKLILFVN